MNSRSRSLRRGARGLIVGGAVAVGLILGSGGLFPVDAQEPAPPAKGPDRQDTATGRADPESRAARAATRRRERPRPRTRSPG